MGCEKESGDTCGSDPSSIKERTREKYDVQWKGQSERAAAERRKALSSVADPLLSLVAPLEGKVVVDLGIGTGSLAFRALELGNPKHLVGIDFSLPGLRVARSISDHTAFKDKEVDLIRADLERIPLANKVADVIISQATVNLLPDKNAAMREIARIAKAGAKVAISDGFRTSKCASSDEDWAQCVGGTVTVQEFSSLALTAGLVVVNQTDLTQQVRALIKAKKWDWPEFIQNNLDYRVFLMLRG